MQFVRWVVTWENEHGIHTANFCLPIDEDPKNHVGAFLNLVELDADDFGYAYQLEVKPVSADQESLDAYQAHLIQRIRDYDGVIPVRGILAGDQDG